MRPWYVTAEALKASLDQPLTARNDAQVRDAIEAASKQAESELGRRFYPTTATYDYPAPVGCVLYVDSQVDADLVSVTSVTVGGSAVDPTTYRPAPVDGPPFDSLEFDTPPARGQRGRPVSVAGIWGYDNVTAPAGELAAAIVSTSATTVDLSDSSKVGSGSLLTVGAERMLVSDRAMLATGQTLATSLPAQSAARAFDVGDGTQLHVGEVLLVGAERLLVTDIADDTVVVRRQWDGTVLEAHDPGATVFAPRRLTVERGVLGTTAATHLIAAPVAVQVYPGPLVSLVTALAQDDVLRQVSGQTHEAIDIAGAIARAQTAIGRDSGFA